MNRLSLLLKTLALLLFSTPLFADPDPKGAVPSVEIVQARIWKNLHLQAFTLDGMISIREDMERGKSPKSKMYPIILRTNDREMIYELKDQPLQIRVVLSPDQALIEKRPNSNTPWKTLVGKERLQNILDSDMTYEDLGLEFIRWDNIKTLGTDSIKTLPAWAFEAKPNTVSSYAKARYWISSQFFAFLRVDAYNSKNEVVKRVEVNGVQKIGNAYVIKEMQISTMIPGRDQSQSRTYIEIRSGKPGSNLPASAFKNN